MPKDLVYPAFLACTDFTEDDFWKSVFEELAFGVCPSLTYINKGYLMCNARGKEFVYKINAELDPETLFGDVYGLLTEKLGLKSTREIEEHKQAVDSHQETVYTAWSNIKKKSIRDTIILQFVVEQTEKFQLSSQQSRELFRLINMGVLLKFIVSKHISLKDGRIEYIQGLEFSQGDFVYTKQLAHVPSVGGVNRTKVSMHELWTRFIDGLAKAVYTT